MSRENSKKWRAASLEPSYHFVHNSPLDSVDVLGLRGWAGAGQIYVWENTCKACPELLRHYKYINEDSDGLKPLHLGHHDADALYIPVGIALKIGDPGAVHITCDCCTHCVKIKIVLPPVNTWALPATTPPPGVNWPGKAAPYVVPGGGACAEIEKFKFD